MEPFGHIFIAFALWLLVREKVKWKGLGMLLISSTFTDIFLPLKAYMSIPEPHDFMHSIFGFLVLTIIMCIFGYAFLKWNGVFLGVAGVFSHALADFVENNFPEAVFSFLGHDFTVSFIASIVALALVLLMVIIKQIE